MKMSKFIYYFLNFTWGCIMNFCGALVATVLIISGKRPKTHAGAIYFSLGKSWGGLELGCFFLTDSHEHISTKNHEFGHSLQNCLWGPLFPFVVTFPSAIRYWLRKQPSISRKYSYSSWVTLIIALIGFCCVFVVSTVFDVIGCFILAYSLIIGIWLFKYEIPLYRNNNDVEYDSIWFENQATRLGTMIADKWTKAS